MTKKKLSVAVIGSGIAGIATAIRLAVKGHDVSVYEANDYPGGKLSEFKLGNYRFDAGPSLFTMPSYVEELFKLAGEDISDHFSYQKLEVLCHYFYEDGTFIKAFSDEDKFTEEVTNKTGESPANLKKALNNSKTLYTYLSDLFMNRSIHDPRTFFNRSAFKAYGHLHQMDFFRTMDRSNKAMFHDARLVQLFNRYATYNGSNPYETPATMNIIPHLEFGIGAFFPKKGMHDITMSLFKLAERQGVKFNFQAPVEEIILEKQAVKGVRVNGQLIKSERVVSNMDIVGTYTKLLPKTKPPGKLLSQPKSSSALIFYWGIKKQFDQLDLHNILFSKNYQEEFNHIFKKKGIYHDPTVYINITSKEKKDDAPAGCENWFTMINTPNNSGQDWDDLIDKSRHYIVDKVNRVLKTDISQLIETEHILDPRLIESRTSSSMGALYGNSSNNMFAAFLRHANFSRKISGLYFCGGSVHPGGGIPMCLSSARIVDRYFR
jgi:phytoene desaturase